MLRHIKVLCGRGKTVIQQIFYRIVIRRRQAPCQRDRLCSLSDILSGKRKVLLADSLHELSCELRTSGNLSELLHVKSISKAGYVYPGLRQLGFDFVRNGDYGIGGCAVK